MTKTSLDIATRALRVISVCAVDETPTAADKTLAVNALQGIMDELVDSHGATIAWTIETVPDALFLPLSDLVAADVASVYQMPGPSRSRALIRVRASLLPDDRDTRADLDDSGTVSTDEAAADLRAQYY